MTVRRIAVVLLFLAGAALIGLGIRNALRHREAVVLVNRFLQAIQDGNRRDALACLQTGPGGGEVHFPAVSPLWKATPDVACRITHLEIDGNHARAKVRIEKDGFVLEPTLHLIRMSSWKISRIDNLKVDPRWVEMQREISRRQGERDAGELHRALKGRSGVSVQRGPLPGRDPD